MKKISLLITGNELLYGDIQDTNMPTLAKRLQDLGAVFFQHMHVSDHQPEIVQALHYLLQHSDVIITTGGLGPTSDDCTRFAIATVLQQDLRPNATALQHIEERLSAFGLPMTAANAQQALFPENAILLANEQGSAYGGYMQDKQKIIVMLPGPPRENQPMFENAVIPRLRDAEVFQKIYRKKWFTLGLVEGQIAPTVDNAVKTLRVETGYRWTYPYLEIKVTGFEEMQAVTAHSTVDTLLKDYTVSTNGQPASLLLAQKNQDFFEKIYCVEQNSAYQLQHALHNVSFLQWSTEKHSAAPRFQIEYCLHSPKILQIFCHGFIKNQCVLQENISIAHRGPEVAVHVKEYVAWQLLQFCEKM